ncbi:MAG: DinB family protein [Gemmatimonadaceae bacterium]
MANVTEVWQRGAIPGYPRELQPIVHALMQVSEEMERNASMLTHEQLWARPANVASVGFHLLHIAGATDRLLTYARDEQLTDEQKNVARAESAALGSEVSAAQLVSTTQRAIAHALKQVRSTPVDILFEPRYIGRARLETTVFGLLFHVAEHAMRHAGQLATTTRIVRSDSVA